MFATNSVNLVTVTFCFTTTLFLQPVLQTETAERDEYGEKDRQNIGSTVALQKVNHLQAKEP